MKKDAVFTGQVQLTVAECLNVMPDPQRNLSMIKIWPHAAWLHITQNPYFGKELLAELSGFRSFKFLRYWIVFKVNKANKKIIVVWTIGHRRDIYYTLGDHLPSPVLGTMRNKCQGLRINPHLPLPYLILSFKGETFFWALVSFVHYLEASFSVMLLKNTPKVTKFVTWQPKTGFFWGTF